MNNDIIFNFFLTTISRADMSSDICDKNWLREAKKPNYAKHTKGIGIVDLFSGCGGLTLGAMEAGHKNGVNVKIKLAVEYGENASNTYEKNFHDNLVDIHKGDIGDIITNYPGEEFSDSEKKLQENVEEVDVVLAGPPCQGHSRLNNHTRSKDPRNKLYLKVIRFVELCKPKFVIIENVLNIKKDSTNILGTSAELLENMGYFVENITIKASEFGIAQNGIRHVQIASLKKLDLKLDSYKSKLVLSDVIDDIMLNSEFSKETFDTPSVTKHKERVDYLFDNDEYDLPDHLRPDCHKNKKHTYPTCYGRLKWDEPSTTITRGFSTMGQGRFLHPLQRRTLTPHEAARIQGFPDFYNFRYPMKRGDLHLMIANAVPPRIGAMLVDLYLSQC